MEATNQELREIIQEYGLTRQQAADFMMLRETSLDRYLVPEKNGRKPNPTFRKLPPFRLKLLIVGIREKQIQRVTGVKP